MSIYHSPFDQFQRYFTVSKIVENLTEKKDNITVLEVGANGHFKLLEFLPKANITFSDIEDHPAPEHISFIKADATNLPFQDGEFDFVVSTDVLEHVPSELRDSFILECFRVSKIAFILACPVDNDFTPNIEKITNETFKKLHHGTDFRWLKEHEEQGLPRYIDIDSVLDKNFIPYFRFNHGRLDWWKSLMQMHFIKEAEPALAKVCKEMDEHYNRYLYQQDVGTHCYRSFWVIGRTELTDSTCLYSKADEATEDLLKIYEEISSSCKDMVFASQLKSEKISYNETLLSEMQQELSECRKIMSEQESVISECRKIMSEQESVISTAKCEMSAFKNSTSWRITRPFRILVFFVIYLRSLWLILLSAVNRSGGINSLIQKIVNVLNTEGLTGVKRRIAFLKKAEGVSTQIITEENSYAEWVRRYDTLDKIAIDNIKQDISSLASMPKISVVMPVYNAPLKYLKEAIESVKAQLYPNWELCIADDASTDPAISALLESYVANDTRIKVNFRKENGHISAASNSALELATGDFIALLDNDDLLPNHALYYVAKTIVDHPDVVLIYSDEDKINDIGERYDPYFKCELNYELLLAQNMICHLGVYKRSILKEIEGFRLGFEGAQDYDLALRVLESIQPKQVIHIPRILYHWRAIPGSTALGADEKDYAAIAARKAISEHLVRTGRGGIVSPAPEAPSLSRVRYPLPEQLPLVSIIIPTRDRADLLGMCLDSVLAKTTYPNYEVIIVDNGSTESATQQLFSRQPKNKVKIIRDDTPFNYSRLNNLAVQHSEGEVICLMNNDIEILTPDWIEEMLSFSCQHDIGCVGARLWYPDGRLQHGGVILGIGGVAGHSFKYLPKGRAGYFSRAVLHQSFSAVTAACLMIRRDVWEQVKGLDENLMVAFNDVDFCLRVRELGYRNVWTPYAEMNHHESASRGHETTPEKQARFLGEVQFMKERWSDELYNDPAYSKNLTLDHEDFSIAWPPRITS